MILKINLINHLKMLSRLFAYIVGYILLSIVYIYSLLGSAYIYFTIFYCLIYICPVVIIHLNYYKINSNITYDIQNTYLIQSVLNIQKKIEYIDIVSVKLYMTANKAKNSGLKHFPYEGYYYAEVKLKDGSLIILTSLLSLNLDQILESKHLPITKIKKFYPIFINE